MNVLKENAISNLEHPAPIRIVNPEPWQWEVLVEALWYDPGFRFFFGEHISKERFLQFMEAAVRGTLESGGVVFASPDQNAVLVWRWYGAELPENRKEQMYAALGKEGTERYLWFRETTDVPVREEDKINTMRPNYIGVLPDLQGRGYGSHLLRWTLDYFDRKGYRTPFLVASTKRSAKLYGPLLGFKTHREVVLGEQGKDAVVVMIRDDGHES